MNDEKEDNLLKDQPGVLSREKVNTPTRPEENPVILALVKILDERTSAFVPRQEFDKDIKHLEGRLNSHEATGHDKFVTQQAMQQEIRSASTAADSKFATQQQLTDKLALSESKFGDATTLKWGVPIVLTLAIGLASWYVSNLVFSLREDMTKTETRLQQSIGDRTTEDKVRLIIEKRIGEENDKRKR
ncbi:hypothetical protein [Dechloromonas sp. CZR5]|uniref:hypothetical protein n=1 Tax=Dechloromonas sp. CZR5 TaxID=2608630 RepID=UPI00123D68EB|nr:hypothetical protein [Dechloromonas sp. CZR5]